MNDTLPDGGGQVLAAGPVAAWLRRTFVPFGLAVLVWAAVVAPLPLYAERPGDSLNLAECVVIADAGVGQVQGDLLLTFASLRRATVADLVLAAVDDGVQLHPLQQVVGDAVPREHFAQQRSVFDTSARVAAAVGLDRAGWPEPSVVTGDGARVVGVLDGFPAADVLAPGDLVVAANGRPIATSDELRDFIGGRGGGGSVGGSGGDQAIELTVQRDDDVAVVRVDPVASDVGGELRPMIGAQLSTLNPRVLLPVDVDVRAGRIGGPSAGLMIALSVYDAVAEEDLLAGRRVAGTGTIAADGTVGPVGRLSMKIVAAARQGAMLFLVPSDQVAEAREAASATAAARGSLQVVGVESIDDAIAAIREAPRAEDVPPARFRGCADRVAAVGASR